MDCFGRIRVGYSPESCQPLLVNTDIVYSIDEERFPGLEVDGCELSLTICPEYLAVQRLTDGAQPPQAHLGPEDHPIDEAHRELYNLLDDLDFLSDDHLTVSDEFVDTLLDQTSADVDDLATRASSCQNYEELITRPPDYDELCVFGAPKNEYIPKSYTVQIPFSSCCARRMSTTDRSLRTSCCGADIPSKPQKKRRYSSISQELNDVTNRCVKRRKLSSYKTGGTDHSDFAVSSSLLSPLGVFSQSYSGHSPLRATSLRQW